MDAKKELQEWLEQHRQLTDTSEREQFFQNLLTRLGEKSSDELRQGLAALRASVRSTRRQAQKTAKNTPVLTMEVFPKNQEEQELLQQLLERMAIPFKMTS